MKIQKFPIEIFYKTITGNNESYTQLQIYF